MIPAEELLGRGFFNVDSVLAAPYTAARALDELNHLIGGERSKR